MDNKEIPIHEQYGISEIDLDFIHKYIEASFNGAQAYRALHPSVKDTTATTQASYILRKPNVQAAYQKELRFHFEYMGATSQAVLNEIKAIASSDITDYIEQDGDNISIKAIKDFKNTKVIKKISIIPMSVQVGEHEYEDRQKVTVELYDKLKALQLMGESLGSFSNNTSDGDEDQTEFDVVDNLHGED